MTTRVTIKLPIRKVLETLNQRLTEREQLAKDYPRLSKQYEKDFENWKDECVRYFLENPNCAVWASAETGHPHFDEGKDKVLVKFAIKASKLPERPHLPKDNPKNYGWERETEELAEAVKLLTMAEEAGQETVSTGTYRNLSRWL
jgi:hypothetical protein